VPCNLQPTNCNNKQKERRAVWNGTPSNLQPVKPATSKTSNLQPQKPTTCNLIYSNHIEGIAGKKIFAFRQRMQYLCGFFRPLARIKEKWYNNVGGVKKWFMKFFYCLQKFIFAFFLLQFGAFGVPKRNKKGVRVAGWRVCKSARLFCFSMQRVAV